MGSSSRDRGQRGQQGPQKPTGRVSKGLGPKGGTNSYYEAGQALPATGGLVKPTGGMPGAIGLNYAMPAEPSLSRDMLSRMMLRPNSSTDSRSGYPENGYPVRGSGDRGGQHASGGNAFGWGDAGRSLGSRTGWW